MGFYYHDNWGTQEAIWFQHHDQIKPFNYGDLVMQYGIVKLGEHWIFMGTPGMI